MGLLVTNTFGFIQLVTFFSYFAIVLLIAFLSYRGQSSNTDFIMGNRSLNFWLTALSAHASDMSSWLFLAYPAAVFTIGVFYSWAAVGLVGFMFLNWQFIAPKIRTVTEQLGSLTLNSYFESRFADTSGRIRVVSGIMAIVYFTIYISSGLVGLGLIVESLFGLSYLLGISFGLLIIVLYVFLGGYKTVAWIDLFQGFFLLSVIVFIPAYIIINAGSFKPIIDAIELKNLSTSLFPDFSLTTFWVILMTVTSWGLGYFGQPHIITKFMGIRRVSDMSKAKWVGISWQTIALGAATLIGLIGVFLFPEGVAEPEQLVLDIVKLTFAPFFAGIVLCAILAATTNVMAAQILVVASNLTEDFYKKMFRRQASQNELLWVSRFSVVLVALLGYIIAFFKPTTIYKLVLYAWSGLGASFGPLLLLSLYTKNINRHGAFAGILVGGITTAIWPYFGDPWGISAVLAGFILSVIAIEITSFVTRNPSSSFQS